MKRLLVVLIAMALAASCAKKQEEAPPPASGGTTAGGTSGGVPDVGTGAGQQAIPDSAKGFSAFDESAQAYLRPYFDEAGTQTSKAVAPGEQFHIFVAAEFNEALAMSACEYKLILPQGIVVLGTSQTDSVIVTLGKYDEDFMIAFRCLPGPKHWISKYLCTIDETFAGGTIETVEGQNLHFMGFTTCDASKTEIKARGGTAQLSKK